METNKLPTRTALRSHLVLRGLSESNNFLESLSCFFEPDLKKQAREQLNWEKLTNDVNKTYGWNINESVTKALDKIFLEKNWIGDTSNSRLYRVLLDSESNEDKIDSYQEKIIKEYDNFLSSHNSLHNVFNTKEKFFNTLVEWLIDTGATSFEVLKNVSDEAPIENRNMDKFFEDENCITEQEAYVCGRFVETLINKESNTASLLCHIAKTGLLTEVIKDLNKPPRDGITNCNLTAFLDSPVAMMLLGVSGNDAQKDIEALVNNLIRIGVKIKIFPESVEEIKTSLNTVLRANPRDRTGHTAQAINMQHVKEDFVLSVASNPRHYLETKRIGIYNNLVDKRILESEEYIDKKEKVKLDSQLHWQRDKIRAREHDRDITSHIIKLRRDHLVDDIFDAKFIIISDNNELEKTTKKFCVDTLNQIHESQIGPVVNLRAISLASWLRTGLSPNETEEGLRNFLMRSCERITIPENQKIESILDIEKYSEEGKKRMQAQVQEPRNQQYMKDIQMGGNPPRGHDDLELVLEEIQNNLKIEEMEKTKKAKLELKSMNEKHNELMENTVEGFTKKREEAELKLKSINEKHNELMENTVEDFTRKAEEAELKLKSMNEKHNELMKNTVEDFIKKTNKLLQGGRIILSILIMIIGTFFNYILESWLKFAAIAVMFPLFTAGATILSEKICKKILYQRAKKHSDKSFYQKLKEFDLSFSALKFFSIKK